MAKKRITMAQLGRRFDEQINLARIYAEDGALASAAGVLQRLATELIAANAAKNASLQRAIKMGECPKTPIRITVDA